MELTFDLLEQLEDLYGVKARHLNYLDSMLPEAREDQIPGGYGNAWRQVGWKFELKDFAPLPKPLRLLIPDKRQLLVWTLIGYTNELIMQVSPESLGDFLSRYVSNPTARRNLAELFMGEDVSGPGLKAFGSLVVCAEEENRFLDRYLPVLRTFAADDPRKRGVDEELREAAVDFLRELDDFRRYLDSDVFIFRRFSKDVKALLKRNASVGILGYGEISSVLTLRQEHGPRSSVSSFAFKKMPPFPDRESVESYSELFDRYHLLLKEMGLNPPRHGIKQISRGDGTFTVFATQARLPSESIGSNIIRVAEREDCRRLFRLILGETLKVARHNREHPELMVGIDIQISNWAVEGFDVDAPVVDEQARLIYIDTSTPMIRENGKELLDPELFMKSVPFFLRPVVRMLYLQDVLDRYYNIREMAKGLISNFIKEGRPGVAVELVEDANRFFSTEMSGFAFEPLTWREVRRYYRSDRRIWILLHACRRMDRFVQQRLLRRKYPYRLPDKTDFFAGGESGKELREANGRRG